MQEGVVVISCGSSYSSLNYNTVIAAILVVVVVVLVAVVVVAFR